MTTPDFFVEEHQILTALFEEGLDILHLRKPNTEPVYSERLLTLIPKQFHKKIVVHDHFYLKEEYGLMGIHLNQRNPELPINYKGHISLSCRTIDDVVKHKKICNYVFLSPIYNMEETGELAQFSDIELREAYLRKIIDKKVMAMGGVCENNIKQIKAYGFGGAVVLGDLWNRFNIHSTQDYKDLIMYFRKLRKLAE